MKGTQKTSSCLILRADTKRHVFANRSQQDDIDDIYPLTVSDIVNVQYLDPSLQTTLILGAGDTYKVKLVEGTAYSLIRK